MMNINLNKEVNWGKLKLPETEYSGILKNINILILKILLRNSKRIAVWETQTIANYRPFVEGFGWTVFMGEECREGGSPARL